MKCKKVLSSLLITVTIISQCFGNYLLSNAGDDTQHLENIFEEKIPQMIDFAEEEQQLIEEIVDISIEEGEEAAELLNGVEDEELYEYGLKNTLEKLYSEETNDELDKFISTIETNPITEEILEDYQNAELERNDAENLEYDVNTIIIGYTPKTNEDYVDSVAKEQFGSVEQIVEIDQDIDLSDFTQEKIQQINKIDMEAKDVVAVVEISKGQTVEQAIAEYSQYADVGYVEPNYKVYVNGLTSDTFSDEQYYLNNINMSAGWNAVEDFGFRQTFVAVIDTGVQMDHPDLKNVYVKKCCVDATQNGYPLLTSVSKPYTDFHGTAVAGIISAEANNGKGISGVGTGVDKEMARIMAIKCSTEPGFLDIGAIINGIYYAVDHGADVINISAGSYGGGEAYQAAIDYAYANDVIVVAAAGNESTSEPLYPASCNHVISVASTKRNNKKMDSTNYGNMVDISAPGENILTCDLKGGYTWGNNTSFSAPIVSGTLAIMKAYGEISVDEAEKIVKSTATNLGISGMGAGLINSGLAIQYTKYLSFKNEKEVINGIKSTSTKGQIKITWRGNTASEGFIIYRATSPNGNYTKIKTITDKNINSYTDSGLKSGKTYYYKIRGYMAYNGSKKYCQDSSVKSAKTK